MAFRATNIVPEQGFGTAKELCTTLKRRCDSRSIEYAAGATSHRILDALDMFKAFRVQLGIAQATPGIAQYAKDQEGDQDYDVAAEFLAVIAALDTLIANIITTFPTDASDYLLAETMDLDGVRVPRFFSGAALASIRTDLDAVSAEIE